MIFEIIRAGAGDASLLSKLAKTTFIESHSISAKEVDINDYVEKTYNLACINEELEQEKNIYHIINYNGKPAGYSKIILNCPLIECH